MTKKHLFLLVILCAACFSSSAQTAANPSVKTFTNDHLSFDYPADWNLVDKSSLELQQYSLYPPKGNVLIMIIAYRAGYIGDQSLARLKTELSQPRIDQMTNTFTDIKKEDVCVGSKESRVSGLKISGRQSGEEVVGASYSFLLDHKFFNLVFIKETKESVQADSAWETIFNSLKAEHKIAETTADTLNQDADMALNGKARKLPRPLVFDRSQHVTKVRVSIDELGNVTDAYGFSGDPFYYPTAVAAAKKAKFTPTLLCGEPIKVTGIITYNYVR